MRIHATLGSLLFATIFAVPVHAGASVIAVPEINPATISGAMALLAGGSLFLLSRLRRK